MHARRITRRVSLLLPLLAAACQPIAPPQTFEPLRYEYLPPIRLNVATIDIEQEFVPSARPPDVSMLDPAPPVEVLRMMAQDRLRAFGTSGRAAFAINNASLIQEGDVISGDMDVVLSVYTSADTRAGYAEARVQRQHTGPVDNLPATLYDMTRVMMDAMNVELEYQIRHSLRDWLVPEGAAAPPVQQAPLTE
ncbi:MAG: hypothetical protein JO227_06080 [Acetobacteraceae bacterium]|nr:hypothetical protein [Acetobacteraceae bacterium]